MVAMNILVFSTVLGPVLGLGLGRRERTNGLETLVKQFIWTLLLVIVICDCLNAQLQPNCPQGEYYNAKLNVCVTCTNCSSIGRNQSSACSAFSDTVCTQNITECVTGKEFYNATARQCQGCRECAANEDEVESCTLQSDVQCESKCPENFVWIESRKTCVFDCKQCPTQHCRSPNQCVCEPANCYDPTDVFCSNKLPNCIDTEEPPTTSTKASSTNGSLAPWGIGLIAIGVVVGIVAFSACFLLMGFCTSSSNLRGPENIGSEESQGSQNGLVTFSSQLTETSMTMSLGSRSARLVSPVIGCKRTSRDFLRQSSNPYQLQQHHQTFNSSKIKGSPQNVQKPNGSRKSEMTPV